MGMGWRVKKLIQDFRYRKVDIGDNSRINLGVQINNPQNMKIGDNTYINGGVFSIGENSKIYIGNDCLISYNVHFRTASHYYENKNELIRRQGEFEKDITIEDDVYGTVKNAKEQYLIDTIKIYHKIQSMTEEGSISYMDEIENSIMERYYYIVYNLLKTDCNKIELRMMF